MKLFSDLSITFKRCDGEDCKKIFFPWQKPALEKDGKIFCTKCADEKNQKEYLADQERRLREPPRPKLRFITEDNPELQAAMKKLLDAHKPGAPVGKLIKGIQYGSSGSSSRSYGTSGYEGSVGYTGVTGKVNDDDVLHLSKLVDNLVAVTKKANPKKRRSK